MKEENGFYYGVDCKNTTPITLNPFDKTTSKNALILGRVGKSESKEKELRKNMGKIIACINEKGGVGKTTTIKNLAAGLVIKGYKVLAMDLDASANLTKSICNVSDPNEEGTICELMERLIDVQDIPDGYGITHSSEGFDIITSSSALHFYSDKLTHAFQREIVLRRYLETIRDKYDYILLDCPAGLGIFVDNALFAADSIIIPTEANFLDVEAMQNLFAKVSMVRKLNNTKTKPEIAGILFTAVRLNTDNNRNIMAQLREAYKGKINIFDTIISLNTSIPESDLARQSIYKYAKNSIGSINYMDFINEFLGEGNKNAQ